LIQYKWNEYGAAHYNMGIIMHLMYTFILIIYVNEFHIPDLDGLDKEWGPVLLIIGILYPLYYSQLQNYSDIVYIWGSVANFFLQHIYGPYHIICRSLMIIIVLQVLVKTFSFMRIFKSLS
jgi:hypothetical protein